MNPLGIPFGLTGAFGPKKMARMGLFGAPAAVMAHGGNQGQAQGDDNPAPEKAYMDTWQGKLAGIGDILLRASGNGGNPMLHYKLQEQAQKQAMAQRQQMAEQQRQWGREDKQWEWENEPQQPQKPTALMQNYEYLRQNHPDQAEAFLKRQTDPIQWITGPDGIPRPYGVGGVSTPPDTLPADFDFGGPTQPASGGFRR